MKNLKDTISRIIQLNEQLSPVADKVSKVGGAVSKGAKSVFLKYKDWQREPAVSTRVDIKKPLDLPKKNTKELPFETITDLTINHIEGGYYNPKFKKNMGSSGETMFGMDRKHGVDFTNSSDGKRFWSLIDTDKKKNPKKWKYLYKLDDNLSLKNELINIVTNQFLKPNYKEFSERYLEPTAKEIVDNDPRLKFHMSYGVWNGEGWFERFANVINNTIKKGNTDVDKITDVAINSRIKSGNKFIANKGHKIKNEIIPLIT